MKIDEHGGEARGGAHRQGPLSAAAIAVAALAVAAAPAAAGALSAAETPATSPDPQVVTMESASPLLAVRVMVRAGSAYDPPGKEGLAALTARAVLEGSFGDPDQPVTKEMLAERTRQWGEDARPSLFPAREAMTFELTVPREVLDTYIEEILGPMLTEPLLDGGEIERLRNEAITQLSGQLRYESNEMVGLEGLDNYIHADTGYGHTVAGSVQGLGAITRDDVLAFYRTYYTPERIVLGVSSVDPAVTEALTAAVEGVGQLAEGAGMVEEIEVREPEPPAKIEGRELTIVAMPNAGATGIHIGFPLPITRADADFWPLYVANVHFGTHRDSHSYLYQQIRQARGYNYGDYSYVEHFPFRPFALFPPFNAPRDFQYFSIWIRPVGNEYAHHLLKAAMYELEELIEHGLSEEQVEAAKNKAEVLYLNLAENTSRLLEARVDDAFYGMEPGYLEGYLERIREVTTEEVNAAIDRYLQAEGLKILIVTDPERADQLAADIAADENVWGKGPEEYRIQTVQRDGNDYFLITEEMLEVLRRDAAWAAYDLGLDADDIRVVPVERLFETGDFVAPEPMGAETSSR